MKLILCRHAETVDNIAGLYAGIRDSALTVHGVEQARRLGQHFADQGTRFDHIFASPLTRTVKTAEAIQDAQQPLWPDEERRRPDIVKVQELIETSFGSLEGVSWSKKEDRSNDPDYTAVESKEETAKRADTFLDRDLLPLFETERSADLIIAVVSHGMLLSSLWKRLLLRLPRKSLTVAPEVTAARDHLILEHLGGWSNTGYLELHLTRGAAVSLRQGATSTPIPGAEANPTTPASPEKTATFNALQGWSTTIKAIDSRQHLVGLKRQRGGIGRLAADGKQKKLDGFFKRQKTS